MKRVLGALLLSLTLLIPMATPAEGGWYTWDVDPCRGDVAWMQVNEGFRYWRYHIEWVNYLVPNQYVPAYRSQGWQCGWLGAPVSSKHWNASARRYEQRFEGGLIVSNW